MVGLLKLIRDNREKEHKEKRDALKDKVKNDPRNQPRPKKKGQ